MTWPATCAPGERRCRACNAEEVALHLILTEAAGLLDDADDTMFAALGLPPQAAWSPRHRQFTLMREVFF